MDNPQPIIPDLPAKGWSYCPRCNQETMATVTPHEEYECPFCGLGMRVTVLDAQGTFMLQATKPITVDEIMRYQAYYARLIHAHNRERRIEKAPARVRMANLILSLVGAFFGVKVKLLEDEWQKEGTDNATKR